MPGDLTPSSLCTHKILKCAQFTFDVRQRSVSLLKLIAGQARKSKNRDTLPQERF